jgi:hypothetical protein
MLGAMPLQNRVTPFGDLIRTSARGTMMGNRGGALHNAGKEIVRAYKTRRWITCVLEFRDRHRLVMSANRYTELFFLDEATALAAGHRPCAECRRERYNAFKEAWQVAHKLQEPPTAGDMDLKLHPARLSQGRKVTHSAMLDSLPDGCFVEIGRRAYLVRGESLLLWAPSGYTERVKRGDAEMVTVLTPSPIVQCFRKGYTPEVHATARIT